MIVQPSSFVLLCSFLIRCVCVYACACGCFVVVFICFCLTCAFAEALHWHGYITPSQTLWMFLDLVLFYHYVGCCGVLLLFFWVFFCFIACFSVLSIFSHSQYVNNIRCCVLFFFFSSPFNSLVFLSKCDIAQFHLVIVVEYFVFIRAFAFGCWCVFWISQRFTYSRIQFIFFSLN